MNIKLSGLSILLCGVGLAAAGCVAEPVEDTAVAQDTITDGVLDGDDHPGVVLLIADVNGGPAWRCSATLLSSTVVLTAGHCTEGATGGRIYLESDVQNGQNNYPFAGPNSVEAASMNTYPDYFNLPWFMADVGVVVLAEPVSTEVVSPDDYGVLPAVDEFDVLKTKRGNQDVDFTAVGYGLQKINPVFVEQQKVRMRANPQLIQINGGIVGDFSFLLSNNAATGGTCFGDSGGPNFYGDSNVVAGVTSFGMNGNCAGTGGVFRMDRAGVLGWVNSFLN